MENLLPEISTNKTAMTAEKQAKNLFAVAQSYVIDCPEMAEAANEDLKAIKAYAKELEAERKEIKAPLADKVKVIDAFFRGPADFLSKAEATLKGSLTRYLNEIEMRRQAELRKAQAAADAERKRIEAKMQQDAEIVDGEFEEMPMPVVVPTEVITATDTPKLAGLSQKKVWSAECVDKMALLEAVLSGSAPIECLAVDQSFLNKLATTYKGGMKLPGVNFIESVSLSSRG